MKADIYLQDKFHRIPDDRISLSAVIHSLDFRALEQLYEKHLNVLLFTCGQGRPYSGNIVVICFKNGTIFHLQRMSNSKICLLPVIVDFKVSFLKF